MTPYVKVLIVVLAALFVAAGLIRCQTRRVHAQSQAAGALPPRNPMLVLDEKARAADGNNPEMVRELVDSVFNQPHVFGRLSADVEATVKLRLTEAELNYRTDGRQPVSEDQVVRLVNAFSARLSMPGFARTNEHEVRNLRVKTMLSNPIFMGKGTDQREDGSPLQKGESISSLMSPLQAVHLFMVMADQKVINPNYQITPDEWDAEGANPGERRKERDPNVAALQSSLKAGESRFTVFQNPRMDEMRALLGKGSSQVSATGALEVANWALDTLGIGGGGTR